MSNDDPQLRVIKLGGSLLDWPQWPQALQRWRGSQPPMRDLLVVGGGAWADLVREADQRFALGEESSHWLCLRLMSVTARLAAALLPDARLVQRWEEIDQGSPNELAIVDSLPLIEQAEQADPSGCLPHAWTVTSDSIAAWLATRLGASELVLLKSTLPETPLTRREAAASGFVDHYFPQAAGQLGRVVAVNLRDESFPVHLFAS